MDWSVDQYRRFETERNRPIMDLLAHVPTADVRAAMDLGCGPGNSTELLLGRWPGAQAAGIDSSPDMIASARQRLPSAAFTVGDIASWNPAARFDLILANAALQWVPGHDALFPRLVDFLAPGGSLAVQMPDNFDQPSHVAMRTVAARGDWATKLANAEDMRADLLDVPGYYRLLKRAGVTVDIWRTTYLHPMPAGLDGIVEWFKGTGLRPYLTRLDAAGQAAFLDAYRTEIARSYPVMEDGSVLLPFPRLFLIATRD